MAIIGTFTKQDDSFQGTLATLAIKAKVTLTPVEKSGDKSPDYRVFAGKAEVGAAWAATAKGSGKPYLSVKLDDPSFAAPILCRLIEAEDGYALVWTR